MNVMTAHLITSKLIYLMDKMMGCLMVESRVAMMVHLKETTKVNYLALMIAYSSELMTVGCWLQMRVHSLVKMKEKVMAN